MQASRGVALFPGSMRESDRPKQHYNEGLFIAAGSYSHSLSTATGLVLPNVTANTTGAYGTFSFCFLPTSASRTDGTAKTLLHVSL